MAKRKWGKPCDWESWLRPASEGMLPSDQRDLILPRTTEDQRRFSGKIVELVEADILSNARNTMRQPQESVELEKKNETNLQSRLVISYFTIPTVEPSAKLVPKA